MYNVHVHDMLDTSTLCTVGSSSFPRRIGAGAAVAPLGARLEDHDPSLSLVLRSRHVGVWELEAGYRTIIRLPASKAIENEAPGSVVIEGRLRSPVTSSRISRQQRYFCLFFL